MDSKELQDLREKAGAATPGPWHAASVQIAGEDRWYGIVKADEQTVLALTGNYNAELAAQTDTDTDFIAAANPETVIALLDRIDALMIELGEDHVSEI